MDSIEKIEKIKKILDKKNLSTEQTLKIIINIINNNRKSKEIEKYNYFDEYDYYSDEDIQNDEGENEDDEYKYDLGIISKIDNFALKINGKKCIFNYFTNIFDEKLIIGKHIKSLSEKLVNLKEVHIYHKNTITFLPETLDNLEVLNLDGLKDNFEISDTFINLKKLYISESHVDEIPETLINLIHIDGYLCNLVLIPNTLINLRILCCSCNKEIEGIPDTLINLVKLDCSGCDIDYISPNFTKLKVLLCSENYISEIPDTLINLVKLDCGNNPISELSENFTKLISLDCESTSISKIPETFINLKILKVSNTQIKNISQNLNKIYYLRAIITNILYIPSNFKNLRKIDCGNLFINTNRKNKKVNLINAVLYIETNDHNVCYDDIDDYYIYDEDISKYINEEIILNLPKHEYYNRSKKKLTQLYKTLINWQKLIKFKFMIKKLSLLYNPKYIGGYLAKTRINKLF